MVPVIKPLPAPVERADTANVAESPRSTPGHLCAKLAGAVSGTAGKVIDQEARCPNSPKVALRIQTQQAVIATQTYLSGLLP